INLLNLHSRSLHSFPDEAPFPRYAILSHTWADGEQGVSNYEIRTRGLDAIQGQRDKIVGCFKQAKADGYQYVWIDLCCVNQTDENALKACILAMHRWYQNAGVCYVFLPDVEAGDDPRGPLSSFQNSIWFTKGWTLQELLAPAEVRFYDKSWTFIGTKKDLCHAIEGITGIPRAILAGTQELRCASVAQRLSWAAGRKTTQAEDQAYCLQGLFDVALPARYDEGIENAFRRLQEEIMKSPHADDSILAWGLGPGGGLHPTPSRAIPGVLASTPADFLNSGQVVPIRDAGRGPFNLVDGCLELNLSIRDTSDGQVFGVLNCGPSEDLSVGIPLARTLDYPVEYTRRLHHPVSLFLPQSEARFVRLRVDPRPK
ncbi:hypothetical protein QBC34DRAFT_269430, partial [Podospora aff. communis PSN243]